jgi:hypothetical protein
VQDAPLLVGEVISFVVHNQIDTRLPIINKPRHRSGRVRPPILE